MRSRPLINVNQILVPRHRTAIRRPGPSYPCRLAAAGGLILPGDSVLDYGCGRGADTRYLRRLGCDVDGYDPVYAPDVELRSRYNMVILIYVLNVIEDQVERERVLFDAWVRTAGGLVVAVRVGEPPGKGRSLADGHITRIGTFQKYYRSTEIELLLRTVTGAEPIKLAQGIYAMRRAT
jgi:DNA phosphorothioation-associated putative methyltransferase